MPPHLSQFVSRQHGGHAAGDRHGGARTATATDQTLGPTTRAILGTDPARVPSS